VGGTASPDFPTTDGAFENSTDLDNTRFITSFDVNSFNMLASTYFNEVNGIESIDVDNAGNVYVTGVTYNSDFPATPGAYNGTLSGTCDAFVAKFNSGLSGLIVSTYLGGTGYDYGRNLVISDDAVFVAGETAYGDFPIMENSYQKTNGGDYDFFIVKMDLNLSNLSGSTLLGGNGKEESRSLKIDGAGNIYIGGRLGSSDFSVNMTEISSEASATDFFVAKLSQDLLGTVETGSDSNNPPDINAITILSDIHLPPPLEVSFECSASDSDGSIVSYQWDFGDGNQTDTLSSNVSHTYYFSGTFNVTCTVKDDNGALTTSDPVVVVVESNEASDGDTSSDNGSAENDTAYEDSVDAGSGEVSNSSGGGCSISSISAGEGILNFMIFVPVILGGIYFGRRK